MLKKTPSQQLLGGLGVLGHL